MNFPPGLGAFARELIDALPTRAATTFALLLAAGLTEGISLLVFVPALQLLHDPGAVGGTAMAQAFSALGVPFGLGPLLSLCVLLITLRAALVYAKNRCAADLHFGFADHLRKRFYRALAEAHWSCTGKLRSADLEDTLTNGIGRIQSGVWALILLAQAAVLLLVYLALSALVSPVLTALAGLSGGAILLALRGHRQRAARLGASVNSSRQACFRELSALVHGLKEAKSFGAEGAHSEGFARSVDATRSGSLAYVALSAQSGLYFQIAAGTLLAAAVFVGSHHLALDLPALLVLIFCVVRLTPYLAQLQGFTQELLFALPAWQYTDTLETRLRAAREAPPSDNAVFTLTEALVATGLSLRYPGAAQPALENVSLVLPAGTCTALVGPSGAGKSTLADIVLGLITPDAGTLVVDGKPLTPELARSWRRQIGYVPQETFLLPESVKANLLLGNPQADDTQLWAALEAAAAADFVRALPQGLDTPVGERGSALSGGERQRLALARALLRDPLLLVLDEATSALDVDNQRRIETALSQLRGQVTTLLITHNPSLVALADQQIQLANGRLTQSPLRGPSTSSLQVMEE